MTAVCCCPPEAGSAVCELPARAFARPPRAAQACPACGQTAKAVQAQTVKSMLSVSLREVLEAEYFFCRTPACPVVYFTADGRQSFTAEQVRERVYQKEAEREDVFVCYCFWHSVGALRAAAPEARAAIVADIDAGIQAGQCACDLRNPQGSCCLGNVRGLVKGLPQAVAAPS